MTGQRLMINPGLPGSRDDWQGLVVDESSLRTSTASGRAESCPNPASLVRREEQSAPSGKLHVQHRLHDA
jgi:hypothetical protein